MALIHISFCYLCDMLIRKRVLIVVIVTLLLIFFFIKYDLTFPKLNSEASISREWMPFSKVYPHNVPSRFSRVLDLLTFKFLELKSRVKELDMAGVSTITLVVVACGDRWKETFVLLKSALLLTKSTLMIYVFADLNLIELFNRRLTDWQKIANKDFNFKVLPVKFPAGDFESDWRKLFKPCSSQRLFLPSLLSDVDSALYVDTDTLFLGPLEQIWSHFKLMNSSQFAALAPEHEDPLAGWYNRFARHPFYKPLGVNTGVMLMNLTRMRNFGWERYLLPIYKKYKLKIPWGDQDIINIIFHFHPDKLYLYPCNYNYRADHCMYSSVCKIAEKEGIIVLHGSRGIFHKDKYPPFQNVYKAVEEYSWGSDLYKDFYLSLQNDLNAARSSNCWKVKDSFLLNIKQFINSTED